MDRPPPPTGGLYPPEKYLGPKIEKVNKALTRRKDFTIIHPHHPILTGFQGMTLDFTATANFTGVFAIFASIWTVLFVCIFVAFCTIGGAIQQQTALLENLIIYFRTRGVPPRRS